MDDLRNCLKTVGIKQSLKAVQNDIAKVVYLAKDADAKVTHTLRELCHRKSVEIIYIDSMKQLGKACGIQVGASAVCVLNKDSV